MARGRDQMTPPSQLRDLQRGGLRINGQRRILINGEFSASRRQICGTPLSGCRSAAWSSPLMIGSRRWRFLAVLPVSPATLQQKIQLPHPGALWRSRVPASRSPARPGSWARTCANGWFTWEPRSPASRQPVDRSLANLAALDGHPAFEFLRHDVTVPCRVRGDWLRSCTLRRPLPRAITWPGRWRHCGRVDRHAEPGRGCPC